MFYLLAGVPEPFVYLIFLQVEFHRQLLNLLFIRDLSAAFGIQVPKSVLLTEGFARAADLLLGSCLCGGLSSIAAGAICFP